ncbi:MAG: hypothetical protein MOB07_27650 [Acidobacteria bacterium]|nr:hypothetical protein [Acidobacteriota bacterium]
MRLSHLVAVLILAISLSTLPRQDGRLQQTPPAGTSADTKSAAAFEALRIAGFDLLYNIDYAIAGTRFEEMIVLNPEHPAGHFYLATTQWLSILNSMRRLQIGLYTDDSFFAGSGDTVDPQLDRKFRDAITKAINVSQARVRKNPNDIEGLYYLGAAYGMLAGYEATVTRRFKKALDNGSRGVDYHRKVIKIDPNYADAYLSIGLYNYVVGTLPWVIRWGMKLVKVSGNPQRGLAEIRKAIDYGKYASDDARTVLVAIYQREEDYSEALKLLEELALKYPRNYLYRLERASVLGRMGKSCESYAAFDQVLKDERAVAVADLIHYQYGEVLFESGEFARADEQYIAVSESPNADFALVSLAHLRRGQLLDAMGQRTSALAQYQIVLTGEDVFDAHDLAKRYKNRPFAPKRNRQEKCDSR